MRERGDVNGHLVAVEVGVEGGADQGVNLDGASLDEDGHEGLDAEAVEGRGAIDENGALLDDLLQDVPNLAAGAFDHALGALDVGGDAQQHQPVHDEGLEEFQGHALGKAALVQFQVRAGHDDGTSGVVDALAEEVLAEASLLAAKEVRKGLELVVVAAGDGPGRGGRCL